MKLARTFGLVSWTLDVPNVKAQPYRDTRGPGREGFRRLLRQLELGCAKAKAVRDRALLRTLAYTFARIGAVVNLKVEDYYPSGKRFLLRFREKGGKEKELPVHHKAERSSR